MKIFALPLVAVAALGLAACTDKAQNESAQAANTIATDTGNTVDAGVNSVDNALDAAGNSMDDASNSADNASDNAANATANTLDNTANAVRR